MVRRRGDVVSATIGDENQNVVVGKNILQIGRLVMPVRFVLALVLFAALSIAGYFSWLYVQSPTAMTGAFNVAVAEFGQVDATGRVSRSEQGARLSEWIYRGLSQEVQSLPARYQPQLWHDSQDWRSKRVTIGVIAGDSPEERAREAANIARSINAHVLIYGNLGLEQDPTTFTPEFYVSELQGQADEIVGTHQLGSPIPLPVSQSNPNPEWSVVSEQLVTRSQVLSRFTIALLYDVRGDQERALNEFEAIDREFTVSWPKNEGKEVLYLFIGREAQLAGQDDLALTALQQARDINPSYARAYIGLGNHFYTLAEQQQPAQRLDGPELDCLTGQRQEAIALDCALTLYQQALELAPRSPQSEVDVKAHLGLANTNRSKGEALVHRGDLVTAEPVLTLAAQEAQRAIDLAGDMDHRYVGEGELALGTARHLQAYTRRVSNEPLAASSLYSQAITHYQECVRQADAAPLDWFLQQLKPVCLTYAQLAESDRGSLPSDPAPQTAEKG
jgi:tetratricopeptide (TPR) repeat protein